MSAFTPEQEARLREIVREEVAAPSGRLTYQLEGVTAGRISLRQELDRQNALLNRVLIVPRPPGDDEHGA